jgi:shikimate kinase
MMRYPVFLLGFMGSGKSSLGKKLARKLAVPFIDLDRKIEEEEGRSIPAIFASKGEAYFRERERAQLQEIIAGEKAVIALGGGTPCREENLQLIREKGSSVYLKVPAERLIGRLRQKKEGRPLIAQLSDQELGDFVRAKLEERTPFYEQADQVVEMEEKSLKKLLALWT